MPWGHLKEAQFSQRFEYEVVIDPALADGTVRWSGTIKIRGNSYIGIKRGAKLTLVLEDGRIGEIFVVKVTDTEATFSGQAI
jgi:hypothetical protein